jgi:hypothetical protein
LEHSHLECQNTLLGFSKCLTSHFFRKIYKFLKKFQVTTPVKFNVLRKVRTHESAESLATPFEQVSLEQEVDEAKAHCAHHELVNHEQHLKKAMKVTLNRQKNLARLPLSFKGLEKCY